ncbi:ATP-binding protein [Kitasatospora sp. NPDC051853]|uniref:ATP-binding protein n=1 Tax=Kitasatospora sp. NPDC051853 TaxID=3364058 RepID=UPI0037B3B0B6
MDSHPSPEGVRNLIGGQASIGTVIQSGTIEQVTLAARAEPRTALNGLPRRGRVFVGREAELGRLMELLRPEPSIPAEPGAAVGSPVSPSAGSGPGPGSDALEELAARHGLSAWAPPAPGPDGRRTEWRITRADGTFGPVPGNLRLLARRSPSGQMLPLPYAYLEEPRPVEPGPDLPEAEPGPATVVVISGPGGVGTTELALQAAHLAQERGDFPGGVLHVDLRGHRPDGRVEPGTALGTLLEALGVPEAEQPAGLPERAQLYRSLLAAREGAVLVVLDDAAAVPQVLPLLPGDPRTRVLVTSRHSLGLPGAEVVELAALGRTAALEALRLHVRTSGPREGHRQRGRRDGRFGREPEAAEALAVQCGRLPLALRMVGALLAEDPELTLAELAGELADRRTALDGIADQERTLRAVIDLSYRHLPADQARLLRLMALAPFPLTTDAATALGGGSERTTRRLLRGLVRAHLVTGSGGGQGHWELPELIRLFLEGLPAEPAEPADDEPAGPADGEAAQARIRLLLLYEGRTRAAVEDLFATGPRGARSVAVRQAQALNWLDQVLPEAVLLAADEGPADLRMLLCHHLERYLERRHLPDTGLLVAETLVALTLELAGTGPRPELAEQLPRMVRDAYCSLGSALLAVRQPRAAAACFEEAAERARSDGDVRDEALALSGVSRALAGQDRGEEAVTALRRALALLDGPPEWAPERDALRLALGRALLREGDAEGALAEWRRVAEPGASAEVDREVARALLALDRAPEAVALLRGVLRLDTEAEQVFRATSTRLALGEALLAAGEAAEAVSVLRVVELAGAMNEDHWLVARSWRWLAAAHRELGEPDRARELLRHAVALARRTDDAELLVEIGNARQVAEEPAEAAEAWRLAVDCLVRAGDLPGARSVLGQAADALERLDGRPELRELVSELRARAAELAELERGLAAEAGEA